MTAPTNAPQLQAPPAGTYRLDPARSSVTFTAKHMFGLGTVRGSFALRDGGMTIAEPLAGSTARATVDATSFQSGGERRDKDVASGKFLDSANNPDITFASTGLAQADGVWVLSGTVTARGKAAPAELRVVELRTSADGFVARATTTIDRYAHGLTGGKGMAGRTLDMEITAQAVRS